MSGLAQVAAMLLLSSALLASHATLARHAQLSAAADASALAAADVAAGFLEGIPCQRARQVAESNGAELSKCEVDDYFAYIEVGSTHLGLNLVVSARAGPPRQIQ